MSRKIPLSIFLSKENVKIDDCFDFEDKIKPDEIQFKPGSNYIIKGFIGKTRPQQPDWFDYFKEFATRQGSTTVESKAGQNSSLSGIIAINRPSLKRNFIICFGHGKKFLNTEETERNFGRNVVLNTAKEEHILAIRTKTYEGKPWFKEMQAVLKSNLYEFDLDCHYELLQKVGAELEGVIPIELIEQVDKKQRELISKKITGYDSVNINGDLNAEKTIFFCDWLFKQYNSKKYKKILPDIDTFEAIRDEKTISQLFTDLLTKINAKTTENLFLCLPEKYDVDNVDGFTITRTHFTETNKAENLILEEILDDLAESKSLNLEVDDLRIMKVRAFKGNEFVAHWSFLKCLTGEISKGGNVYALMDGSWYQIKGTFYNKVITTLNKKITSALPLPDFDKSIHKTERGYNEEVAKDVNFELFDRQLKGSTIGQGIEPCDLLYKATNYIHVKRSKKSTDLSHLFAQGVIANELLLQDQDFSDNVLNQLSGNVKIAAAKAILNKNYILTFGVIVENRKTINAAAGIKNLPAFSILNLSKTVETIEKIGTGIKVELQLIALTGTTKKTKTVLKKRK